MSTVTDAVPDPVNDVAGHARDDLGPRIVAGVVHRPADDVDEAALGQRGGEDRDGPAGRRSDGDLAHRHLAVDEHVAADPRANRPAW